jgi:hypothetical protein
LRKHDWRQFFEASKIRSNPIEVKNSVSWPTLQPVDFGRSKIDVAPTNFHRLKPVPQEAVDLL